VSAVDDDVDRMESEWRIGGDAAGHSCNAWAAVRGAGVGVVFSERRRGVDAVIDRGANAVVVGRGWEHLNVVFDRLDAGNALHCALRIVLEDRTRGIAVEHEGFAVDAEGEPIEDAVVGEIAQLLLDLGNDAGGVVLRPGGGGGLGCRARKRRCQEKNCG